MFFLQFVSIYILLLLSADDNRSIYIERDKTKKNILKCLLTGRFPGKRVFFGGELFQKNGVWQSFGVDKCLKM